MSELGYSPFDADNHYYEARDAFPAFDPFWARLKACFHQQQRWLPATLLLLACFAAAPIPAQPQEHFWGVYPVQGKGQPPLYTVVRSVTMSREKGGPQHTLLNFLVTTAGGENADRAPCPVCTASRMFALPGGGRASGTQKLSAMRNAPGPVTYLHLEGREYMVTGIQIRWTAGQAQPERVSLLQTGFLPFKKRLHLRLDAPLPVGPEAQRIAAKAFADVEQYYFDPDVGQYYFNPGAPSNQGREGDAGMEAACMEQPRNLPDFQ